MAFIWRDDNSLTTYRHKLSSEQQSQLTSIILKMRTKYILHTDENLDFDAPIENNGKSPNKKRQKKSITTTTNEIIPTINLAQLKVYFTKGTKRNIVIYLIFSLFSFIIYKIYYRTYYKNKSKNNF